MKATRRISSALAMAVLATVLCLAAGCAGLPPRHAQSSRLVQGLGRADAKLVRAALDMLDPTSTKYNAEKGKAILEYSLRQGAVRNVDVPAPVMLELLRQERVASEKSRGLEQQLEVMKEIDLNREQNE